MEDLPLMGIAAPGSNWGKTRLILALLDEFIRRGLKVAVLKHAHHVSWSKEKDSGLFMEAGAQAALVVSSAGWLLSAATEEEADYTAVLRMLKQSCQADLVLVEGYKMGGQPKLQLTEETLGTEQLLPQTVALISSAPQKITLPCFEYTNIEGIADFIVSYSGVGGK